MYDLIRANKRNSWFLVLLTSLVLVGLSGSIGMAVAEGDPAGAILGIPFGLLVAFIMLLISWFGGKSMILSLSDAKRIAHEDHPQLFNVVEEMAIASGLPLPAVYIIEDSAPNAFATGRDPEHSAVAVTSGLLAKLNRDELQGVIAHEMAHIKNYDIRFAMLMAVMVGVIALISDAYLRGVFRSSGGSSRRSSKKGGGGAAAVFLLLALLFAILAPLVGKLIQLAVSRQREYLADATAAELTRYPEGLAQALIKISRDEDVLEAANRATQHLYIVNPIKPFEDRAKALFSTHPPVEERIARLRSIAQAGTEIQNRHS
jgi:heat shock protein HtpX